MNPAQVASFTSAWTKAQPTVFAFVSATVFDFNDAEDILQKVASIAIEKYPEYDPTRPFISWAIGIARFEVLRYLRDRSTDRHSYISDALPRFAEAVIRLQPELDIRRHALTNCLKRMDDRSRAVLELRYGQGKKSGNIAKQLRLSSGNVSAILNRAYRRLRQCIERQMLAENSK